MRARPILGRVYSIDTPPPTVSGNLHLGHVYSYSHADFMARFFRMRGYNVFYPMGFDDNGLPTERLVRKTLQGPRAADGPAGVYRARACRSRKKPRQDYRALWQRLGLSIDWRYTYRTIDAHSRRCSQYSFIDLYQKGLAYRAQAPMLWCPECHTAIAQADLDDLERDERICDPAFSPGRWRRSLPIATTRPELLAACVAVFVHPQDARYRQLIGQQVRVPLYGQAVPVLADPAADPEKGTGAVMCCTFGDQADVAWWYRHKLPLVEAIDRPDAARCCRRAMGCHLAGLTVDEARRKDQGAAGGAGPDPGAPAHHRGHPRARALRYAGGIPGHPRSGLSACWITSRSFLSWASRCAGTRSTCRRATRPGWKT